MSKFTKELVNLYASKLLLNLTDEENALVLEEFDIIDQSMDLLNEIPNLEQVEPMTHALLDFEYVLRDDDKVENISIEEALQNCDCYEDREISVPKVVETKGGN